MTEKVFSLQELVRYDGDMEPEIYIAFQGVVYDVTDCPKWRSGMHEGQHFPAQDLTLEFNSAPHPEKVFQYPCVKRIGIIKR